MQFYLVELTFY